MKMISTRWSVAGLLAGALLLGGAGAAEAQARPKIGAKGSSEVPGSGGKKVNWKISVRQTGKRNAQIWMHITNPNSTRINLVLCAMLNMKDQGDANPTHDDFVVTPASGGGYRVQPVPGGTPMPPSYHFGCRNVSLGPGSTANSIDTTAQFSQNGEVESCYFDILAPGRVTGNAKGPNKFLYPKGINSEEWANVWGGGSGPTPLASVAGLALVPNWVAAWPLGNWITMAYPGFYPAQLEAVLAGAPAGTQIQLVTAGVAGQVFRVESAGGADPCAGKDLEFVDPFVVPQGAGATDVYIQLPNDECGKMDEGAQVELYGNVYAQPGASFYSPDQWMYGVYYEFFYDHGAPYFDALSAVQTDGGLQVDIKATDDATMVNGAIFLWSAADGTSGEEPIDFAVPAMVGNTTSFSQLIKDLPFDRLIDCRVRIFDEGGNSAEKALGKLLLRSLGGPSTPRLEDQGDRGDFPRTGGGRGDRP